ncbi:hypothetical protein F5X99DRAFT_369477, partial [Biscogniauxia marginata]
MCNFEAQMRALHGFNVNRLPLQPQYKRRNSSLKVSFFGIDHFYAIKTINEVHRAGGKIISF